MASLEELLVLQGQLFLLILLGMFFRRYLLSEETQSGLTALVVDLVLPCNIIMSFQMEPQDGLAGLAGTTFLISVGVQVVSWILAKTLFARCADDKRAVLQYSTLCSNAGFLGMPLAEGLFAGSGIFLASIYLIPQRVAMWTIGLGFFLGKQGKSWKKVALNPCLLAVAAGILLLAFQIHLPLPLSNTITSLGKCNTALSMFLVGMIIVPVHGKDFMDPLILGYCAVRLILIPLIVLVICRLLAMENLPTQVSMLLSAMPAGATSALLAEKYHGNAQFAAGCVTVSTVLSLIATAAWCAVM